MTDHAQSTSGLANGRAIATMCLGIACLVVNDSFAKWLTEFYSPLQIIFMRNLIALPFVTALVVSISGRAGLTTNRLGTHALRGFMLVGAGFFFFVGLKHLPLAEATSIVFAAPIFITALSVPLLGEAVGWRRWAAVMIGFAGVLIIVRPGGSAFQPESLYVVITAMLYALIMITARRIDRSEDIWTLMFFVTLFPLLFAALAVPFFWTTPQIEHLLHFSGMAVFGTLGMTLISQGFRLGAAAVVAPFEYTALIWASLLGWLVWGEIPEIWVYVGAVVIIASGIYIVYRETRRA